MKETREQLVNQELIFLKLGGSLITDKDQKHTARNEVINALASEIKIALDDVPERKILLGHGSGSFGHVPAKKYGTRKGVHTAEEWQGFVKVWREASALNHMVLDKLTANGIPAIAISPLSSVVVKAGKIVAWNLQPVISALEHGLVPVVYGDVVFDEIWGGTILSTEDLFAYLADALRPETILLAGIEPGVWRDYPACRKIFERITPGMMENPDFLIDGSASVDVTGGMRSKVTFGINLVEKYPSIKILIFDGTRKENMRDVFRGKHIGTIIRAGD